MNHKLVFAPSFDLLSNEQKIEGKKIVKLLEDVMDEYYQGKPFPYLDLYKPDNFTYFDSGMEKRKNSVEEMSAFFGFIDGKVIAEKDYLFDDLAVQFTKDVAVVSFQMFVRALNTDVEWNVTEVFQKNENDAWQIIHSHYSYIRPMDIKQYPVLK